MKLMKMPKKNYSGEHVYLNPQTINRIEPHVDNATVVFTAEGKSTYWLVALPVDQVQALFEECTK